jgi:predicted lipase
LFISLRGTQSLYDLFADLDIRMATFSSQRNSLVRLHRGFFDAVASCFDEVVLRVSERLQPDTPVYVTGHSLGGAMAALMNAMMLEGMHWRSSMRFASNSYRDLFPRACYSFGMPRYGNRYAVAFLAVPYHVFNERDLIPTVPPRFLGFADSPDEFCLTGDGRLLRPFEKGGGLVRLRNWKLRALGLAEHRMERYIERVESAFRNGTK